MENSTKKFVIVIGCVFIIIGIVILVFHFNSQKVQAAETTAKIIRIDNEVETDSDGFHTTYYTPVIEYTVNEQRYIKKLTNSKTSNSIEYRVGDEITIQYNPDKPQEITEKGNIRALTGGLVGGIVAIGLGIMFIYLFFKWHKEIEFESQELKK